LLDKHPIAKEFLPAPPMVCYTRDRNLRDILVKAVLPPPSESRPRRAATSQGFHRCGKRGDCALCSHSVNTSEVTLYDGDGKSTQVNIPSRISCLSENILYSISCTKSNGQCAKVHPQYIGETGKSAKGRCAKHIGTVTNKCHDDTTLPVGAHFRLPGHDHSDLRFTPIELIKSKDPFVRKVRERFYIKKFSTLKKHDVSTIEHGLNLKP